MKKLHLVFILINITLLSNLTIAMPIYSYNDLGNWSAVAINDRRAVVGNDGGSIVLYQDGNVSNLGSLGGNSSSVSDINNNNKIVGKYQTGNNFHAFQYDNGSFTDLHEIVSTSLSDSLAVGINDNGKIVFNAYDYEIVDTYVLQNTGLSDLSEWVTFSNLGGIGAKAINNNGQIVGCGASPEGTFPVYRWDEQSGLDWVITDTPRIVTDINDAGQIVGHGGTSSTGEGQYSGAWTWKDGVTTELFPDGEFSKVDAINNSGMMVGSDPEDKVVLIHGDEMEDMTALINPDLLEANYDIADINNFGDIIGTQYIDTDNDGVKESYAFLLTPEWDRVTADQFFTSETITLEDTLLFDVWWDLGLYSTNLRLNVLAYVGDEAEILDFEINGAGSSLDWTTLELDIPEWAFGRDAQIIYSLADAGQATDPTVYLRNINSASSVPEPANLLLIATGLTILVFSSRKRKQA
jgi:probable HAF family extracellular repeat protein